MRAATSFANETLVVAGAGSGKTALLLGRAKYLLDSRRASADEILFLAFNKKAAAEITERSDALGLELRASTFHAFGNSILRTALGTRTVVFTEDHEVANFIQAHLDELARHPDAAAHLGQFLTNHLVPQRDLSTFKDLSDYSAFVRSIPKTLQGERVKSHGEWLIANFLWRHSIPYEYEALYRVGTRTAVHKPDFTVDNGTVYIEYFGVDRSGGTAPGIDSARYRESMTWKKTVHEGNGTTLVSVTYQDLKDGVLLSRVESGLRRHGVELTPRPPAEVIAQAARIGYKDRVVGTLQTFLQHVRAQRPPMEVLRSRAFDRRSEAFLQIFVSLYAAYVERLADFDQPDFSELIHGGANNILDEALRLPYRHVLIDEFQDIAHDRFRLIEALRTANPKVELMMVGDDWQAIYSFAGSDIEIMRAFARRRANRLRVDLGDTFRLPQSLATAATRFVTANPDQLRKKISSSFDVPNSLVLHWDTSSSGDALESNLTKVVERIGEAAGDPNQELLVLARYRNNLPTPQLLKRLWKGTASADTIHRAKGREADYVVVTDVVQDNRGFPSTIVDDPVLEMILVDRDDFPFAEERRLFYVALTRARCQTHLICPSDRPSLFAVELKDPAFAATQFGDGSSIPCPACSVGLIARDVFDTYRCSNSPLCEFQTPVCPECRRYTRIVELSPLRYECPEHPSIDFPPCPRCAAGRLVIREGPYGTFASCHMWSVTRCDGK